MQPEKFDVRWADRVEVDADGFWKVVRTIREGMPPVDDRIQLGRPIGYKRGVTLVHYSNLRIGHPELDASFHISKEIDPSDLKLEKLHHKTALEMTQALGFQPSPLNPLWSFVFDDLYWVVDTITLLEQGVATSRELLAALLSPWRRMLIRRLVVDAEMIWATARPIRTVSARIDTRGGGEWFARSSDTCCTLHWLLNSDRLQELQACFASIRKRRPLELPSLLPASMWRVHALRFGRLAWVKRLTLVDEFPVGDRVVVVVSDTEDIGARVEVAREEESPSWTSMEASAVRPVREAMVVGDVRKLRVLSKRPRQSNLTPGDRAVDSLCLLPLSKYDNSKAKSRAACCVRAASVLEPVDLVALRVDMCIGADGTLLPQFLAILTEAPNSVSRVVDIVNHYLDLRCPQARRERPFRGLDPSAPFFPRAKNGERYTPQALNRMMFYGFYRSGLSKFDRAQLRIGRTMKRIALRLADNPLVLPFTSPVIRGKYQLVLTRAKNRG